MIQDNTLFSIASKQLSHTLQLTKTKQEGQDGPKSLT